MSEDKIVISEAAVEAAARAACIEDGHWGARDWDGGMPERVKDSWRDHARTILEAAASLMLSDAWGEGHSAGVVDAATKRRMTPNPYEPTV